MPAQRAPVLLATAGKATRACDDDSDGGQIRVVGFCSSFAAPDMRSALCDNYIIMSLRTVSCTQLI